MKGKPGGHVEVRGVQRHVSAALSPGKRPIIDATEGRVDPRASLDGCEKPRLHRYSIPGPSSPQQSLYRLSYPGRQYSSNLSITYERHLMNVCEGGQFGGSGCHRPPEIAFFVGGSNFRV
jgi:hypothetical protein